MKIFKSGTKKSYLPIFELEFEKGIVILEIDAFKFF